MVGRHPYLALPVLLHRRDAIVGQSALYSVALHLARLQVIAQQTVVGAHIQPPAKLTHCAHRRPVVQTVTSKHLHPAVRLQVQGTDAHRGGSIKALTVGRERYLRDKVVGNAVLLRIIHGSLLHGIGFGLACSKVQTYQSTAHGSQPQVPLTVTLKAEHADHRPLRQRIGMIGHRTAVYPPHAFLIGAYPYTSLLVLFNIKYRGREVVLEVTHHLHIPVHAV